ncbi:hypothetical protein FSP39_010740 [Pinctada imbricata]|uniref:Fe2OG dioxygenase domain-containing protein n=1 Tax=Pinctada imbricata TaxID=66713 RepID=A0AA88YB68_PINIB|nr:hypothetical protein FSP39_010740 [Pinctada imbricata]
MSVPIIDMSKVKDERKEMAAKIVKALETSGFLYLDNVPGLDHKKLFETCKWFFSQPWEFKEKLQRNAWSPENKNYFRGYFPVVAKEPSRKEGFEIGRDVDRNDPSVRPENWFYEPNVWPEGQEEFKSYMKQNYEVMHETAMEMLRLIAIGLGLEEDAMVYLFAKKPCSTFRIMHYPPWDGKPPENALIEDGKVLTTPDHSDSNFITLLINFNYVGLERLSPEGQWVAVPPRPGSLIMNIGDLLDRMTGNRFKATRHRVIDIGVDRYSIPFFLEPEFEADVGRNFLAEAGKDHVIESYGRYMIHVTKYVRKYFEFKVLPDFLNVKDSLKDKEAQEASI